MCQKNMLIAARKDLYQCPLGLRLHFYEDIEKYNKAKKIVSMPFRARDSFLLEKINATTAPIFSYQCPFGLKLHFYDNFIADACKANDLYQCPFGLVLHFYNNNLLRFKAAVSSYQCPFGLVLHFYGTPSKT